MKTTAAHLFACLLIISLLCQPAPANAFHTTALTAAGILYVTESGSGTGCTTWADACDLQTALSKAIPGSQIWVAAGTYKPTSGTDRSATFTLKSGVEIYGGFPAAGGTWVQRDWETNPTTLSGNIGNPDHLTDNSYHVVKGGGANASAVLDGFTISGGWANSSISSGGGMYNYNSSPTLTNIIFSDNTARYTTPANVISGQGGGMVNYYNSNPILTNVTFDSNRSGVLGGGMYNSSSSPMLTDVTFSAKTAWKGGGMYNSSSSPILTDVTFSANTLEYGGDGGGMYNDESSPILTNVTFNGNAAGTSGSGRGMYNENSSLSMTNVTFSGNSAGGGGGMSNQQSNLSLTNGIFSSNSAVGSGGGMLNNTSSLTLTNVTFSSNSAAGNYYGGGGMCNINSSITLRSVTFSNNTTTQSGGGMYNVESSLTLTTVTFSGNSASGKYKGGGGMYNYDNSSPDLTNVTFSKNSAEKGGGMYNNENSSPELTNVTFSNNSAEKGGGMYNYENSSPSLTNVTFSGNTANSGGGMYNYDNSSPSLTNVTFSGNAAEVLGGGMYNGSSSPVLTNVTFTSNTAGYFGGGMHNSGSSPTVTNAILWGNTPSQIEGSAALTYSDVQGGWAGDGNIDSDPLLGILADNGGFTQTHALGAGSPAIDTADPTNCPVMDQRGYARPIDGDGSGTATCDMGAYEYASYPLTFPLTLDVVGSGSVAKDPDKTEYFWGEVVMLTPTANPGWTFSDWSGDASGTNDLLTVIMDASKNVTAAFTQLEYILTVAVDPVGSGTVAVSPEQASYHYGDTVALTPLPEAGWSFSGWSGDASGSDNPLTYIIIGNTSITATFHKDEQKIYLPLILQ